MKKKNIVIGGIILAVLLVCVFAVVASENGSKETNGDSKDTELVGSTEDLVSETDSDTDGVTGATVEAETDSDTDAVSGATAEAETEKAEEDK